MLCNCFFDIELLMKDMPTSEHASWTIGSISTQESVIISEDYFGGSWSSWSRRSLCVLIA